MQKFPDIVSEGHSINVANKDQFTSQPVNSVMFSAVLEERCHHDGASFSFFIIDSVCYKLGLWSLKDVGVYKAGCVQGNVGSTGFTAGPIPGIKSLDISAFAAFGPYFFKVCLL